MTNRFQHILSLLLIILFLTTNSAAQDTLPKGQFRSPLEIPLLLSGNFGEMRSTHFHTGLDFKTGGEEGQPLYAVADGYVMRIKVQAGGYGNAIYLSHPNGYTSVYGHLQRYNDSIGQFVLAKQYEKESFEVNLWPTKIMFPIKKGDVIGYSGNTGRSGGPHLHFEIRDAKTEHPINPLLLGFEVKDNLAPTIYSYAVYPINNYSFIEGHNQQLVKNYKKGAAKDTLEVWGELGFGIRTNDYLNGSNNKCGVYIMELWVDTNLVFTYKIDDLDFNELRYIKSHYDYHYKKETGKYMQKAFVAPNNKFSKYGSLINDGVVNVQDGDTIDVKFVLLDAYRNKSELNFVVKGVTPDSIDNRIAKNEYTQAMPWKIANSFETEDLKIEIPKGALYEDLFLNYSVEDSVVGFWSNVHEIHKDIVPLGKAMTISIKTDSVNFDLFDHMCLVSVVGDKPPYKTYGVGGDFFDGWVTGKVSTFGKYAVGVDTIPPEYTLLNLTDSTDMTEQESIKIKMKDDLSGVKKYVGRIDGHWVMFRHDAKSNLLFYQFSDAKIEKNTYHTLVLELIDNRDNATIVEKVFYW